MALVAIIALNHIWASKGEKEEERKSVAHLIFDGQRRVCGVCGDLRLAAASHGQDAQGETQALKSLPKLDHGTVNPCIIMGVSFFLMPSSIPRGLKLLRASHSQ